jgi:predicted RNA-binding protein with PIN domain
MRWIVDGMNVIGSRPDGWWRDRSAAMARLVEALGGFAAATGEPVAVVLDGRPRELPAVAGVEVAFASTRGRDAADRDIGARVEADAWPADLTVVTSDAELAARVRRAGAAVAGAGEFRRRLDAIVTPRPSEP